MKNGVEISINNAPKAVRKRTTGRDYRGNGGRHS